MVDKSQPEEEIKEPQPEEKKKERSKPTHNPVGMLGIKPKPGEDGPLKSLMHQMAQNVADIVYCAVG